MSNRWCKDCGPLEVESHRLNWFDALLKHLAQGFTRPVLWSISRLPRFFRFWLETNTLLERAFLKMGLLEAANSYPEGAVSWRTTVFFDAARRHGITPTFLKRGERYLNHFVMRLGDKEVGFEGLPRAEFLCGPRMHLIDDKLAVKKILAKDGFPHARGAGFWWYDRVNAEKYAEKFGTPVVIKPRWGSMSQHVTVGVQGGDETRKALARAFRYNPCAIIEHFVPVPRVFRATVIDYNRTAVVWREPAHVDGDGLHSAAELVELKNQDKRRGVARQKDTTIFKIAVDETSHRLLKEQGLTMESVPQAGQRVFLQEKVILDLGADLFEVTSEAHPDNIELFRRTARIFDCRLVGIDFIAEDISCSWKDQNCAIIELNSLPYIDMHHHPTSGAPVSVADWVAEMVLKYYFNA